MKLTIRPLTPEHWPALENLFGTQGPVSRCWCMYWRIGNDYRRRSPNENKSSFCELVKEGRPPGLLAFDGELAVGWCQLTPRHALPKLDSSRLVKNRKKRHISKQAGEVRGELWSLSCFYIRKGYRKQGVTGALIASALKTAQGAGASALEAYPLDSRFSPSASFTGYLSTFLKAGFKILDRPLQSRPLVRYEF